MTNALGDNELELSQFNGHIVCEAPNNNLSKFDGTMSWRGQKYSLDNEHILLRGTVLRNTAWCYGVVVFAGKDTKLMQNSGKTKLKRTSIDRLLNFIILGVSPWVLGGAMSIKLAPDRNLIPTFPMFFSDCVLLTMYVSLLHDRLWGLGDADRSPVPGNQARAKWLPESITQTRKKSSLRRFVSQNVCPISFRFEIYLPWDSLVPRSTSSGATVIALLVFFSYAIVLNTVVPISLYVR